MKNNIYQFLISLKSLKLYSLITCKILQGTRKCSTSLKTLEDAIFWVVITEKKFVDELNFGDQDIIDLNSSADIIKSNENDNQLDQNYLYDLKLDQW